MPPTTPKQTPVEEVLQLVDDVTTPEKMSKTEFRDFLDELIGDLQTRLSAVEEELEKEGGEE